MRKAAPFANHLGRPPYGQHKNVTLEVVRDGRYGHTTFARTTDGAVYVVSGYRQLDITGVRHIKVALLRAFSRISGISMAVINKARAAEQKFWQDLDKKDELEEMKRTAKKFGYKVVKLKGKRK